MHALLFNRLSNLETEVYRMTRQHFRQREVGDSVRKCASRGQIMDKIV